jgi:hypothetical protein
MGQHFGYDFSRVRVHTGASAEESAREVNAHAYTVGHDIVLGGGQRGPQTSGRRTLAHELTHVMQQESGIGPQLQRQSKPDVNQKPHPKGWGMLRAALRTALPVFVNSEIV